MDARCRCKFYQEALVLQETLGMETFFGLVEHIIEAAGIFIAAEALESGPKEHAVPGDKKETGS
jgi:hypothetical protein